MTEEKTLPQPPNPLGHDPNTETQAPDSRVLVAMLSVPKSWNRLVIATVVALFMITVLVTMMAYLNWRMTQDNFMRITEMETRLAHIEAEVAKSK